MAVELRVCSPVLHVVRRYSRGGGRSGFAGSPSYERGARVAPRAPLYRHHWEVPVFIITGLTDAEREDLSRKVGEANKRSKNGSGK